MKKKFAFVLASILMLSFSMSAYASPNLKLDDNRLAPLVELGLYEIQGVDKISEQEQEITLVDENGDVAIIETSVSEEGERYVFKEGDISTDVLIKDDDIFVNGELFNPQVETRSYLLDMQPKATSENWITDVNPFDNGPYSSKPTRVQENDIQLNQKIATMAVSAILFLLRTEPVASALLHLIGNIATCTGIKSIIQNIQREKPDETKLFIKEDYYESSNSSISGRPIVFYYKIKIKFAKDLTFNSFYSGSQIVYAKQLIYA